MARLYSNENFPQPVVVRLRELGHDVLTVLESGFAGQAWSDEEVLKFADAERRIVLTLNRRHFIRLHNDNSSHYGILACSFDSDFERQATRIHEALATLPDSPRWLIRVNQPIA